LTQYLSSQSLITIWLSSVAAQWVSVYILPKKTSILRWSEKNFSIFFDAGNVLSRASVRMRELSIIVVESHTGNFTWPFCLSNPGLT